MVHTHLVPIDGEEKLVPRGVGEYRCQLVLRQHMLRVVPETLRKASKGLAPRLYLILLLSVEEVGDVPLRRRAGGVLEPGLLGLRILCRDDLHLVPILQLAGDVDHLVIYLRPDAVLPQLGIKQVGKVEHREVLRTADPLTLAGEDEHILIGKLVHHRLVVV